MEASESGSNEHFEVDPSAQTVAALPRFEGANVCRVAALSTLLGGDRPTIRDLASQLAELGFPESMTSGRQRWSDANLADTFVDSSL